MTKPKLFLPKDIYKPLGMRPPRFSYLIKKGVIRADVQESLGQGAANVFSAKEALRIGLLYWLEEEGFTLEAALDIVAFFFEADNLYGMFHRSDRAAGSYWLVSQGKSPVAIVKDWYKLHFERKVAEMQGEVFDSPDIYPEDDTSYRFRLFDDGANWNELRVPRELFQPFKSHVCFFNLTDILQETASKLKIVWKQDIEPLESQEDE